MSSLQSVSRLMQTPRQVPLAALVFFAVQPAIAQLPPRHSLYFEFYQFAQESGPATYSLKFGGNPPGTNEIEHTLTTPSGTLYSVESPRELFFNSFAEVSPFFGTWSVVEKYDATEINYQVTLQAFSLSDVDTVVPKITSPISGATVSSELIVEYSFADGRPRDNKGYRVRNQSNISNIDFLRPFVEGNALGLDVELSGPAPGSLELAVATTTHLHDRASLVSVPIPGDRFDVSMLFRSVSTFASYTVVPEPASWLLLGLAGSGMLSHRRRQLV